MWLPMWMWKRTHRCGKGCGCRCECGRGCYGCCHGRGFGFRRGYGCGCGWRSVDRLAGGSCGESRLGLSTDVNHRSRLPPGDHRCCFPLRPLCYPVSVTSGATFVPQCSQIPGHLGSDPCAPKPPDNQGPDGGFWAHTCPESRMAAERLKGSVAVRTKGCNKRHRRMQSVPMVLMSVEGRGEWQCLC